MPKLTAREKICCGYLSGIMEANAAMVGERIEKIMPSHGEKCGFRSIGSVVLGNLQKKGLVYRVSELNAWALTIEGRDYVRGEKQR